MADQNEVDERGDREQQEQQPQHGEQQQQQHQQREQQQQQQDEQQQQGQQQQQQQGQNQPDLIQAQPIRTAERGEFITRRKMLRAMFDIEGRLCAGNRHGRQQNRGGPSFRYVGGQIGHPPVNLPPQQEVVPTLATLAGRAAIERCQQQRLAEIVEKELELLRVKIYRGKLQLFKLELELGLPRSEYTQDLPHPIDGRRGM